VAVLAFIPSDAGLLLVQAGVVACPRPLAVPPVLARLRSPWWAAVPLASIVGVIFAIRYLSDTATALTYLALVAVPPLAAFALGWCIHGSRPWLAGAAVPLFALAWGDRNSLSGEAAAAILSGLSCVALGALIGSVTPAPWLKAGIILMSAADVWLVASDLLQAPNAQLAAAHPAGGLPQLQSELFGSVALGYGDLFVAALLGAALAGDVRLQRGAALLTLVLAALFDLLFLAVHELPATVPVAAALLLVSARRRWWTPADATPRPAR
jgi:hypothetical protein